MRVTACREDVDVARCVRAAPDAADVVEHDRRTLRPQVLQQQRRRFGGLWQQVTARVLFPLGARPKNELFLLWSQTFQPAHAAVSAGGLELLDRLDAKLGVQQCHGFGSNALKVEQVEYRRRKLLEQILVIAGFAGFCNLTDFGRELFADARDCAQLLVGQVRELVGGVCDRLRRIPIRANLEWVLALDFEQIGDLGKDTRDGQVFHLGGVNAKTFGLYTVIQ